MFTIDENSFILERKGTINKLKKIELCYCYVHWGVSEHPIAVAAARSHHHHCRPHRCHCPRAADIPCMLTNVTTITVDIMLCLHLQHEHDCLSKQPAKCNTT